MQTYVVELIQRRLFVRVAADLAFRLPRVRVEAWDRHDGPELVNRFFDILTVQKIGAMLLLDGIAIVLGAGFGLIILASYSPYLLGFDVVILAALTFAIFLLGRGAVRTSIQESRAKYAVAGCLEEMARAPVAYKMGLGPDYAIDRADRLTRTYLFARRRHFAILMRQIVFALGFQAVATAGMLGLGGWLVIQEQLTLGQLVAAELIVATVIGSFAKLGKHMEGWYDLMAAVEKLGHLIDLPLERRDGEDPRFAPVGTTVRLHGVSYAYGHREVLDDLDLEVEPGEHVAIVGPSGSGKSTLADLLYGLRDPTRGHITLDGINLRDLELEALREEVALVKGLDIVDDTILENVRMGRNHIGLNEVHHALEVVKLADEVAALPDGMHTRLFPTGSPLSLGQARRLMLARAIAGRPNLLVLDEALDGLDLDSRGEVLDAFFKSARGWTVIVVTHSQEVASRCDRAVAVVGGRAEHGLAMDNGHTRVLEDWLKEVGR
jgi:ABC-type bacteriocin/lantibiotic exporter with double-glycine peptidase domain